MEDIKIIVDTGSDIPPELAEKYDIGILRFLSLFGEDTYVQGEDITNEEFYDKLEAFDGFPTTSQTPYGDMYDFLKKEAEAHSHVIYFALSGAASGQFQTASIISRELMEENPKLDIRVVNTMKYSLYIANTAVHAAEMIRAGKNVDEIVEECSHYVLTWRTYLLVDTLKYLEKGGRLSKTAAFVGSLLDIKPVLGIEGGLVVNSDKLRGKKKLVDKLLAKIEEDEDFIACDKKEFLVVQSDDEKGREVCEKLRERYGDDCVKMYGEFGPLIGTHVGRGAYAILCRVAVEVA
ncbi:MAG: DegV family protein [bacterium]|nr:DegV family protein [bacterium]